MSSTSLTILSVLLAVVIIAVRLRQEDTQREIDYLRRVVHAL